MSSTDERPSARYGPFLLVLALFFLSGASGLVYQVIWVRLLTRIFGTTTFAVSALLAVFMAGLGLGAALASRYLIKVRYPLRWFGAFEIGVGLYALALNAMLPAGEALFLGLVSQLGLSGGGENFAKVVLAFVVLLPPTTLMGAGLPLLVKQSVNRLSSVGLRTGSLYAINTLGAAGGCFVAGFYTIPLWGMETTTQIAATVNSFVGLAAIALSFLLAEPDPDSSPDGLDEPESSKTTSKLRWAIAAFTVSGFAAIGLEVVWTRLLTLVFKGYSYSFTAMLTVFLIGIALGSVTFARPADRARDPEALLGILQIAIGISVTALTALLVLSDDSLELMHYQFGYDFTGHMLAKFFIAFVVLGVPTFLFGAQFPVVSRLATDEARTAGRRVGLLYAMNVVGSILGALVTGYVLIPLAGTQTSLRLLALSMVAMGFALVLKRSQLPAPWKRAIVAGAVLSFVVLVVVTPSDLSLQVHRQWLQGGEKISYYEEGASATVMVGSSKDNGTKRLLINGNSASNSSSYGLSVNRIQGSIPFLFDRMPKKVLAACFGTGIISGTLSQFDIEQMDGVDISPEVIRAAEEFREENYDVVNNDRVTIHIDDGRNFLLKSRERYDVITMEPMPPALAGVADMYTKEFYELCNDRLNPGGFVSQWVPMYYLTLGDMKMLYRTFADSFPYAMVFYHNFDSFLVGSDQPLRLSPAAFEQRLVSKKLARDLAAIELRSPEDLFSAYLMGRDAMLRFAGNAPIVTDDHPIVEFTAPKAVDRSTIAGNYLAVTEYAESVAPLLEGVVSDELHTTLVERFEYRYWLWNRARDKAAERLERARNQKPPPGMVPFSRP
ncbi:MAG: fused MFS/spermidine synthase [Acidobacteriota bacterium]|nr:MAG: fused MFS/spermidine synthase [Acidobacteriota bacterium]